MRSKPWKSLAFLMEKSGFVISSVDSRRSTTDTALQSFDDPISDETALMARSAFRQFQQASLQD